MLTLELAAAASLAAFSLAGQAQSDATATSSRDQQTTPAVKSESAMATANMLPAIRITSDRYRFTATDTALEDQSATRRITLDPNIAVGADRATRTH
jgi:iron complex outermembrane receptor protein